MSDHIPDVTKMISDTPRTNNCDWSFHLLFAEAQKMERELNAANQISKKYEDRYFECLERIKRLIAERDTARRQADRHYKLREEFRELLGTDDVEQGVAVVRDMKERISKLNDYVAALETAGDLMANELSYGYDVDMWNQAKEDKL